MKVRYSPRALADLADIADFPGCGRAVEQRPGVRVLPVFGYPYLVFYTVVTDVVFVLHIRHGAREPADPDRL